LILHHNNFIKLLKPLKESTVNTTINKSIFTFSQCLIKRIKLFALRCISFYSVINTISFKYSPARTKFLLLWFIIINLFSFTSCQHGIDWTSFRGKEGRGASSTRINPPLGVKWKLRLQLGNNPSPAFNPPVVKGETIYFGAPDGNFYALDIKSGYMRWVFSTEGIINSIPYIDGEKVYFGSNDGKLYAVYTRDGKEAWNFQADSTVQSTIVGYRDMVVFATDGGSIYFLSSDGNLKYRLPNPVWHYNAFQIQDNVLYFAPGPLTTPHSMGAFDMEEKSYLWILNTWAMGATWYSFPALRGKYLFMSTSGYRGEWWELTYYAFNSKTGRLIWYYRDNSVWGGNPPVDTGLLFRENLRLLDYLAPAVWKGLVIYTSGDSLVRAFNIKSGDIVWTMNFDRPTSSAPTVAGGRVYFGIKGGENIPDIREKAPPLLVCLNARNGKKLWEMELEGEILSAPVIAGKWIIFGTDRNYFYVLEELY